MQICTFVKSKYVQIPVPDKTCTIVTTSSLLPPTPNFDHSLWISAANIVLRGGKLAKKQKKISKHFPWPFIFLTLQTFLKWKKLRNFFHFKKWDKIPVFPPLKGPLVTTPGGINPLLLVIFLFKTHPRGTFLVQRALSILMSILMSILLSILMRIPITSIIHTWTCIFERSYLNIYLYSTDIGGRISSGVGYGYSPYGNVMFYITCPGYSGANACKWILPLVRVLVWWILLDTPGYSILSCISLDVPKRYDLIGSRKFWSNSPRGIFLFKKYREEFGPLVRWKTWRTRVVCSFLLLFGVFVDLWGWDCVCFLYSLLCDNYYVRMV